MLPRWLHEQLFKKRPSPSENCLRIASDHLSKNNISIQKDNTAAPIPQFKLPKIVGSSIAHHFYNIANQQAEPINQIAREFSKSNILEAPKRGQWQFRAGWTKYYNDKNEPVEYPEEESLCFDVETMVRDSNFPVIACAVSSTAWYSWVSPRLIEYLKYRTSNDSFDPSRGCSPSLTEHLIPLGENDRPRIIVGHSVGYDRARIKEMYSLTSPNIHFLDTAALHIAVTGLCKTCPSWIKTDKMWETYDTNQLLHSKDFHALYDLSLISSLREVYLCHFSGELDKLPRNVFVDGSLDDLIVEDTFQELMSYCAKDVTVTYKVFQKLLPKYLIKYPHPASFVGMMHISDTFLTTKSDWNKYINNADIIYKEQMDTIERMFQQLADEAVKIHPSHAMNDPWLQQLDWTRIAPILLRLKWKGYPVYYTNAFGWTYRVPINDSTFKEQISPCTWPASSLSPSYEPKYAKDTAGRYYRIPYHEGLKCSSLLSRYFLSEIESGTLSSDSSTAKSILRAYASCSYWKMNEERIKSTVIVYDTKSDGMKSGMILPMVKPLATVTRRPKDYLWMSANELHKERIGSELKALIQSPDGYKIIGARLSSLELWIYGLLGDAQFGIHGASAMSWMLLQGGTSVTSNLHTRTANIMDISDRQAEVINNARTFGSDETFLTQMIKKYNKKISEGKAKSLAKKFIKHTIGLKWNAANAQMNVQWLSQPNSQSSTKLRSTPKGSGLVFGGSESYTVNTLNSIIRSSELCTPFLGSCPTEALNHSCVKKDHVSLRLNWIIQSSSVDYIHLMLVAMKYLIDTYDIKARFMLLSQDELKYLVKEEDSYRAALALQVSHLWTRALFSYMLGIEDLPLNVAFLSSIDFDSVLRNDIGANCSTLSYVPVNTPNGISVSIHDILQHQTSLELDERSVHRQNNISADPDIIAQDESLLHPKKPLVNDLVLKIQSLSSAREVETFLNQHNINKKANKHAPAFINIAPLVTKNLNCNFLTS